MKLQKAFLFVLAITTPLILGPGCLPEDSDGNGNEPQGTGCDDLIPISASTELEGIAAERVWFTSHYPGYTKVMQFLGSCGDTPVDVITIEGPYGDQVDLYFDISSFYGQ